MKTLLIALSVLASTSAFAQSTKVVCGTGSNNTGERLQEAVAEAENVLNDKIAGLSKVVSVSAPTVQITKDEKHRNQVVTICVSVELN